VPSNSPSWFTDEHTLLAELKRSRADALATLTIPGYHILREIKRGGQGVVFEARQLSTGQRVAVKVLRDWSLASAPPQTLLAPHAPQSSLAGPTVPVNHISNAAPHESTDALRRFRREIDLAAQLRHPGIVRVYDSGTTADGRTYLVMEYVEGPSLDDWARPSDAPPRPTADILEMLAKVCDAITAAHQRGIIHRDIKPSNIRVDATGQPRVLDFGLAKLDSAVNAEASLNLSINGQFLGSLPWAAPEQARGDHLAVDVRTDVYALGALLYQLLSGRYPCDVRGDLSKALSNITAVPPTPLRKLVEGLPEPIEVICGKALAKVPADRYQSPIELAADIRHHLAGEPITARRESAWRGARRRLRRYQIALTIGALGLAALAALAWYTQSQRAKLAEALDVASTRTRQQDAFNAFLTQMLSSANPGEQGKDVRVVDVLTRASDQVPVRFADDPLTAAKLYGVLAQTFRSLGQFPEARKQGELAINAANKTGREMTIADTELIHAKFLNGAMGKGDQAEPYARRAFAVRTRRLGPTHEDTLDAAGALATSYQLQGRLEEAETAQRAVLEGYRQTLGDQHRATVTAINNYASVLRNRGKYKEALEWFKRSSEGAVKAYGPEHPSTLITTANMATCLTHLNRTDEAVVILLRVAAAQERALGPEHPNLAATLNMLGNAMQWANTQQPDDGDPRPMNVRAVDVFRRAIAIASAKQGPAARNTLVFRSSLAVCLTETGRHQEALEEARSAYEACTITLGPDHWQTIAMLGNVAQALAGLNQLDEAITITTRVYHGMVQARGENDSEAREWADKLAKYCTRAGRADEAALWKQRGFEPTPPSAPATQPPDPK